ncbi:Beta-catenin-interacting protein ICAT, partial [Gilliamella apicola SCGC AB-598-I20]
NMPNSTPVQKEDAKHRSVVQTPNTAAVKEETSIDNEDWLNFNYDNKSLVTDTGKEQTSAVESNAHDLTWLEQLEEQEKFEQVQQNVNTSQRKVFKEQPVETVKAGFDDATASSDFKWASSEDDQQPKSEGITVDDIFSATQAKKIDDKIQYEEESFLAAEKADQQISDLSEVENDASQPDTNWYRDKPIPQWNVDFRTDSKSELVKKEIVNPDEQQLMSETLVAQDQEAFVSKDNVVSADIDWEGLNLDKEEPALSTNDETITSQMHDEKVIPDLSSEDIAIGLDYEDSSLSLSTEEMAINLDHESANSASEGGEVAESFNYDDLSLSLADDESTSSALNYENQTVKSSTDDNIPELATFDEKQTSQPDEEKNDLSSLDFTLSDDFEISVPSDVHIYEEEKPETQSASTPTSAFATGTGVQKWENEKPKTDQPLTPEQMAVPLQAKLELAKMYLEMDDAITARQTLRELVEEANGAILTEAQNLLYQLGG